MVKAQGEVVKTLQLKLKQPKTARTISVQIVEMPETGGLMCPVKAYEDWRTHRKEPIIGGRPVYTWACGAIVTIGDINKKMEALLLWESTKVTTRAFRPALPTILAREGASEDMLLSLGRWTSKSYLNYVRKDRIADW